jgi:hypothetical protein
LGLPKHVIVGLVLQSHGFDQRSKVGAKECHAIPLIRIRPQAHPHEMQMIRHQAVHRADQAFPCGRMKKQFTQPAVQ